MNKLKNLNKEKYGKSWRWLFLELTNSKIYLLNIVSLNLEKKFLYKNKEIRFKKIIKDNNFYYEIFVDNKKINQKFYQELELNSVKRMRILSGIIGWSTFMPPIFIFIIFANIFSLINILRK